MGEEHDEKVRAMGEAAAEMTEQYGEVERLARLTPRPSTLQSKP